MAVVDRLPDPLTNSGLTIGGGAGLVGLLVVLTVVAGPLGLGAGVAVAGLALLLPATHSVAFAHALLLPVVPAVGDARMVVWAALLAVLVGPARRVSGGGQLAATTVALSGGLWLGTAWLSGLAVRAAVLLSAGALLAYVLHRYEVVAVRVEPGATSDE